MPARIAVAGAGLVGARHARIVAEEAVLAAIADPAPAAVAVAEQLGAPLYPDLDTLIAWDRPDAVIVATPNQRHEADALSAIRAGVPVLVEKPITGDLPGAERLVAAATQAGVPLLVGHHRRYNPIIAAARQAIDTGRLGRLVTANAQCWILKPEAYFHTAWRREPGAGPIFINLIHDVDLMLHLCGPVRAVQAAQSSATRGFAVEDTAAIVMEFESGALGTLSVSDAAAAPWSWELTAAENPAYPATGGTAYHLGGTEGALSIPDLTLWSYPGARGWHEPIDHARLPVAPADPLVLQVRHLADVATGGAAPHVTGQDGLAALRAIDAVKRAAEAGTRILLA